MSDLSVESPCPSPAGRPAAERDGLTVGILLAIFAFLCGFFRISDVDIGYHIRTGELALKAWRIPSTNTFSFVMPDHPWLLHQWLPAIPICWIDTLAGYRGIIVASALLGMATFLVAARAARVRGAGWGIAGLVCVPALLAGRFRFNLRPDLLSAFFFGLMVLHLAKVRRGARPSAWTLVGLQALWANCHAGYVYGAILIALFCAGECLNAWFRGPTLERGVLRRTALLGAVGVAGSVASVWCVNPNGPRVLLLPFQFFSNRYYMDMIAEYGRAVPAETPWFYAMLLAAVAAVFRRRWRDLDWRDLLAMAAFAFLGVSALRNILFFVIAAVPVVADGGGRILQRPIAAIERRLGGAASGWRLATLLAATIAALAGVVVRDPVYRFGFGFHTPFYPEPLFRTIADRIPGNVFNDMRWGGPMLWRMGKDRKIFADGRLEAYEESFWRETYMPAARGDPAWQDLFARYGIHAALVHCNPVTDGNATLAARLAADADWALVGWVEPALLFVRRIPEHAALIADREIRAIRPTERTLDYIAPRNASSVLEEAGRLCARGESAMTAHVIAGRAWMVQGNYAAAEVEYDEALRMGSAASLAARDLAFCKVRLGRYGDAARLLRKLPRDATNLGLMGEVAEAAGRIEDALAAYALAATLDPQDAGHNSNAGLCAARLRKWDEATTRLLAAAALEPSNAAHLYNLALACRNAGRLDKALTAIESARKLDPTDTRFADMAAAIRLGMATNGVERGRSP